MSKRLDAAIDEWLLDYKKNSVKVATYSRLRCSYETMLRYPVATKQIDELKTIDIQRYANQLAESGYALSTIKKELHLLTGRDNAAARALYASLGYAADDEVHYVRRPDADGSSID